MVDILRLYSHNTFLNTILPIISNIHWWFSYWTHFQMWWLNGDCIIWSFPPCSLAVFSYRKELSPYSTFFSFINLFMSSWTHEFLFIVLVVTHYWCYSFWSSNHSRFGQWEPFQMAPVSPWFIDHVLFSSSAKFPWSYHVLAPALESAIFLSHFGSC